MAPLEQKALLLAKGKILDCGAGSGCHSLALQDMGKEVDAIDISPLSVEVMEKRGVKNVSNTDLFSHPAVQAYDTVLMLMNGSGIIGKLENMEKFFMKMKQILRPGGVVYMDSSDLKYLFEDEDGSYVINLAGDYYGEVDFRMQYKQVKGNTFDWLYIDFQTLSLYASKFGFKAELIKEGKHYDYLAALRML
jgi:SAM-dependent methyltransferase